jgi:hypothetical protein
MIDMSTIPMYAGKCYDIKVFAETYCNNKFLGIFSANPSLRYNKLKKRYFSEIHSGLCFNGTGTSVMLEIKSLK